MFHFRRIEDDMKKDIAKLHPQITKKHTTLTEAIIQQYNNRLIKNQTKVK